MTASAYGVVTCPPSRNFISSQSEVARYALKINQVGEADRKTAAEFADKAAGETKDMIERRYAATGDFACGDAFGQGQLTIKNDIVTTSAHIFGDGSVCPIKNPPLNQCKFTIRSGGKLQDYDIDRIVGIGYKCGAPGTKLKANDDWLVLKLKVPVGPTVRPCAINKDPSKVFDIKDIVQVGKSHDFNPTNQKDMRTAVRHYARCGIQYVYGDRDLPLAVETDCDSSGNSSGSSVLTPGQNPILLGINKGAVTSCDAPNKIGPYRQGCWATMMTPIAGDLLAMLRTLEEKT